MPDVINIERNLGARIKLNPFDLMDRLTITLPCPVDMTQLYSDIVLQLDTTDYRQSNLAQCLGPLTGAPPVAHYEVDDVVMWVSVPEYMIRPVNSRSFHVPHSHPSYPDLRRWMHKASAMDNKIRELTDTIDANILNLRKWRNVRRHWPDFANSLLACMDEHAAAEFVVNMHGRVVKSGTWSKSAKSGPIAQKYVNSKAREKVVNAIQAGLLLPDRKPEAWIGYYNDFGRRQVR